ncbi:putative leader peptide [Embleya sp. AB8]
MQAWIRFATRRHIDLLRVTSAACPPAPRGCGCRCGCRS